MKDTAIKVKNVSKLYKLYDKPMDRLKEALNPIKKIYHSEFYALKNVSFEINKGETVGFIGKNGCGKSTLLKIITGLLKATEGTIQVEGRISALLELGAGFNPEYTGIENIYLNGTMLGYSKEEIEQKMNSILEFADIGKFVNQPVKTYSSGMFVRLAFAVAINVEPEILIVDEALSVGDIFFQSKCYKKFEEFKKKGKTIIFVTHDMGSVIKYCDRVIVLNQGSVVEEGSPADMVDVYKKILANLYYNQNKKQEKKGNLATKATSEWKKQITTNPKFLTYGNNMAEIFDFAVIDNQDNITNVLMKNKEFTIKFKVKFNHLVEQPIFAMTIKDLKGTEITGTNTMLEYIDTGNLESGNIIEVTFTQVLTLQAGNYLVSLGCTGYKADELVIYHRLYDIFNITVISDKNTVGFFDMNCNVKVEYLN